MLASLARPTRAVQNAGRKGGVLARAFGEAWSNRRGDFSCSRRTVPWRSGFRARTENAHGTRKTMIVALARKLLIALRRLVTLARSRHRIASSVKRRTRTRQRLGAYEQDIVGIR
jgi:hypothetical protein